LHEYKQLESGYATNADITRMGHVSRGFTGKRLLAAESHDKDRLMYDALTSEMAQEPSLVLGNSKQCIVQNVGN
jgi:hypothetical protein